MGIEVGDGLPGILSRYKKKLEDKKKAKAQRKLVKRFGTGEKHADVHSGAVSEDFRQGYNTVFGEGRIATFRIPVPPSPAEKFRDNYDKIFGEKDGGES